MSVNLSSIIDQDHLSPSLRTLWSSLTGRQRQLVTDRLQAGLFSRNETVCTAGEPAVRLYVLVSGTLKESACGQDGRQQILRLLRPVTLFGFQASFSEDSYPTTVTALERCQVLMLPMDTVMSLMRANRHVSEYFLRQLSSELACSYSRTVSLTQKHIRGRLAEALLLLLECGAASDGQTLSTYMSREDLASFSNMTTSNAIRTLSAFAKEGLVSLDGKRIRILQVEELHRISLLG